MLLLVTDVPVPSVKFSVLLYSIPYSVKAVHASTACPAKVAVNKSVLITPPVVTAPAVLMPLALRISKV
ncbi:hypothetical protein [Flavobacterium suaedae]|uniref:hypothetical protein n=1 Tax=Flavobacterium suaedae TaxID=1767027 RepID=UPI001E55B06A|nr:hypothetical protein [Flavobacterium suaedae]